MMYLQITCNKCGRTWTIYENDKALHDQSGRTCRGCGAEINPQIWDKMILKGFAWCRDAEKELMKHAQGYHSPVFAVDYKSDINTYTDITAALAGITAALTAMQHTKHKKRRRKRYEKQI